MSDVKISVRDNGPFLVEEKVTLVNGEGNEFPIDPNKLAIALCRYGHSANRAFCNGAHKACGFESAERAG
ncbi:MAG: iron-binding protein [Planctomycetaceae bacterium]|nr:iron-binding protein [Planctomycetaceae bacterium]